MNFFAMCAMQTKYYEMGKLSPHINIHKCDVYEELNIDSNVSREKN